MSDQDRMTDVATLADLKPDKQNARRHGERNLAAISTSLQETGFGRSLLLDRDNNIIAGNATAEAAAGVGLERVRVIDTDGTEVIALRRIDLEPGSDMTRKAGLYDNRAAELAEGWDGDILAALMAEVDIAPVLMTQDEAAALIAGAESSNAEATPLDDDRAYSRAVESPVYAVTGECPAVADLINEARTTDLLAGIEASAAPDDVKQFLRSAAARHLKFDYAKVAEFYAHADAEVQDLMERSALVIIDVDQAIEYGFARLASELRDIAAEADADAA